MASEVTQPRVPAPYESWQDRRAVGFLTPVFGFGALLMMGVLAGLFFAETGFWDRVLLGVAAVFWTIHLATVLWRYCAQTSMAVRGCPGHLAVGFAGGRGRWAEIPYATMASAAVVAKAGRGWAVPSEGVFCPYGLGARPGVRITFREPWGDDKLKSISIVVPDPERLAGFLNERIADNG